MINITDGLPWPLKAAPQTFLYILQLFEVCLLGCRGTYWNREADLGDKTCQSVRPKITSLLFAVQTLWKAVEQVSPEVVADNVNLRKHISEFFECVLTGSKCGHGLNFCRILQRTAIRLHIVLRVSHIKKTMAAQTISACLVLEEQRLAEAGKTIVVSGLLPNTPRTNSSTDCLFRSNP